MQSVINRVLALLLVPFFLQRFGTVRGEDVPFCLGLPLSPLFPYNYTKQDYKVSIILVRYLSNFAKSGWVVLEWEEFFVNVSQFCPSRRLCISLRNVAVWKDREGEENHWKFLSFQCRIKKVPLQPDSGKMLENDRKSVRKQLILLTVEFVYVLTGTGIWLCDGAGKWRRTLFRKCWFNVQICCKKEKKYCDTVVKCNYFGIAYNNKANSGRTIPIDWKRDYYRLNWPSNEGTRFGSIGKHLERNNGSRNAGDGISLIESRSSRKNNNIISTLVGGCQIQCMGRFYEGGRAKRSETFMQIWSTWKTRSPVDFLHKAQKWFSLWVNSEEYAGMWVIVITAQSTSSNTSDT